MKNTKDETIISTKQRDETDEKIYDLSNKTNSILRSDIFKTPIPFANNGEVEILQEDTDMSSKSDSRVCDLISDVMESVKNENTTSSTSSASAPTKSSNLMERSNMFTNVIPTSNETLKHIKDETIISSKQRVKADEKLYDPSNKTNAIMRSNMFPTPIPFTNNGGLKILQEETDISKDDSSIDDIKSELMETTKNENTTSSTSSAKSSCW
eukprot:CAMPEP_0194300574 /NCGR_PEP_ID=MMETSP0169-20130528/61328_1 /TAXON_ID=218684 /ORGANISM="Corethron pennatum, Strain L29A3" /LENGTH=210 /DNA_ID=CAMNT_0039050753 /DNA_START=3298 /DNA_END=3927 /DNA_ORIENTATION=-